MLAPHIKKKVDELWNRFWAAGLTNPLVAVEQITYLLFLKRLEDIDLKRQQRGFSSIYIGYESCKWSYIRQEKTNPGHLIDIVFPWLRELEKHFSSANETELDSLNNRMADAYFQLDPNKGKVLSDAIDAIDQLFARAGEGSAAQDIMGDTFEYLLSEVATAGKNGQFRTPRHLIRFMVELLDPEPGQRVIDPAAGTGGFLFSTQQYLMRKYSAQENLVLEWDGTPHRTDCAAATPEQYKAIHNGANFVGLDNDRTMARIGWMNLILHDVTNPHLLQADSLSKREGKAKLKELLEPGSYQFVLGNPPFTGTVDSSDLEPDTLLFPRIGGSGKKKDESITNKSELLFLWLMLDLLDIGGRCAVIIPEGVLFGNTDAHVRLRRELLVEHVVEGVISLPGGVFQPYTGVKTSILIFRKVTRRDSKQSLPSNTKPLSEYVWFYEVDEDGYTKDAKRNPRPGQQNDLWDALIKFKDWTKFGRNGAQRNEKTLLQPHFYTERWRQALLRDTADKLTPAGEAFGSLPDTSMWDGQAWGIHELFPELPADPKEAEEKICSLGASVLTELAIQMLHPAAQKAWDATISTRLTEQATDNELLAAWKKTAKLAEAEFKKIAKEKEIFFEKEDSPALTIWKELVKTALEEAQADVYVLGILRDNQPPKAMTSHNIAQKMANVAREIAKLDGFDVILRSLENDQTTVISTAKHWVIPVREWARNDEWQSADGQLIGSHDADGIVRSAYLDTILADGLYDNKGALKDGLLDPDCIEAREWNLSAGQYKPFDFTQLKNDKSVFELINTLKINEQNIIKGLDKLLAMLEGQE
ncbi:type I restriction-modification system subunit M [Acinetobacter oleivorans]|uniref:type I restriction-modification system subunit M n=1 Tax=Acinetobacter oleivorans TaxID=1148157 RepID=UPI0018FF2613|nr:class I SAM-dependent DNA methyltransferase [Acinetobacter oleivorans]MBJ8497005.1 N-6 DNA methylase [Acinetobacter oleivorans]